MRAYACAREGVIVGIFTLRKILFLMDGSLIVFWPPNVHRKQAVVFHKATRCFHQNDTLFFIKRYVVFIKTSRRLKCNNALCWLSRLTLLCCKRSNDRLGIILLQKKVGTKENGCVGVNLRHSHWDGRNVKRRKTYVGRETLSYC